MKRADAVPIAVRTVDVRRPLSAAARVSSRSSPSWVSGPWQVMQRDSSSGPILTGAAATSGLRSSARAEAAARKSRQTQPRITRIEANLSRTSALADSASLR